MRNVRPVDPDFEKGHIHKAGCRAHLTFENQKANEKDCGHLANRFEDFDYRLHTHHAAEPGDGIHPFPFGSDLFPRPVQSSLRERDKDSNDRHNDKERENQFKKLSTDFEHMIE